MNDRFKKYFILLIFTLFILNSNIKIHAKEYHSNLSSEEIKDIFSLKVEDVKDPWTWISKTKTFIIVEKNEGDTIYWWNVPNLQMTAKNNLYDLIAISGYGSGSGKSPQNSKCLAKLDNPNTALKKYGFNIPSPTYVGERPLITISTLDVLLPDNMIDTVGRLSNLIFDGEVTGLVSNKDMKSLMYLAPRDYDDNITFEKWVKNNWYDALGKIKNGQVLLTKANQETGEFNGKYWVKDTIINKNNLSKPGLSEKYICQKLKEICGSNYPDVAKNIIITSNLKQKSSNTRIMPYDFDKMTSEDKKLFSGLKDPRCEIQKTMLDTGYDKHIFGLFKSFILSLSGKISEITICLNSFSNFTFLENIGLNPLKLWNNSITHFLILIMLLVFVFYVVKSALKVVSGKEGNFHLIIKVLSTFLVAIFILNLSYNQENTYKSLKYISTRIFNLSHVVFEKHETLNPLYGTGNSVDKENVELWLPYFNTWTHYNTNHSLLDSTQIINKNYKHVEEKGLKVPKIGNIEQNLWCTILADNFTKKENYSGDVYRVVDHFMAPRIDKFEYKNSKIDLKIKQNENYNGDIQSHINFSSIPFQLLVLFFVLLKVLLFFEFIFNISMFIFNLTLSVTSKFKISLILKELGASMLNISIINIIIGLTVWSTLSAYGISALFICIFYIYLTYNIIKSLGKNNSVFTPKFFRPIRKIYYDTKDIFVEG